MVLKSDLFKNCILGLLIFGIASALDRQRQAVEKARFGYAMLV